MNGLLVRKVVIGFLVGFVGALVTALDGLSRQPNFSFDRSAVIALVAGLIAAGARAALALSPVNLVPSDAQHSLVKLKE